MTTSSRRPLGVAIAGFGWMGRVHTQAYARVLHHFPQLTVAPQLVAVADEVPGRAEEAADQFGFTKPTRDWREVAADPEIAAVSIAAPNFLHREIGVAMAKAGKHIWIEKPVGLTADDARRRRRRGEAGGGRRRGRVQLPQRAGRRRRQGDGRERRAGHHHARPVPALQRLRRAPRGRAELALRA